VKNVTRAQKNEQEHAKAKEKEQEEEEVRVEVSVEATSAELELLKQELAEKTALVDEFLSRLKYLQADFENYKKMVARERELYEQCATETLIKRLLPLIDTIEAALASAETCEDLKTFVDGVELIYRELMDELRVEGLKPIKAVGEKFDPYKHEVVMASADDNHPEDTIVEELGKGYMLGAKVLRTSKVKIAKAPSDKNEPDSSAE
jgi:molecular chaperone GrpE